MGKETRSGLTWSSYKEMPNTRQNHNHDSYLRYAEEVSRPKSNYSASKYHNYAYQSYGGKENVTASAFQYAANMDFVQYRHHPSSQLCAQECPTALKKKSKKMHCHCKCKKNQESTKEIHTVFVQAPPTIIREVPQPPPQQTVVRYISHPQPQPQPVTLVRTSPVFHRTEVVNRSPIIHRVDEVSRSRSKSRVSFTYTSPPKNGVVESVLFRENRVQNNNNSPYRRLA
jgi:hypothetical protein